MKNKYFDQPESRVNNEELKWLPARNSPEQSLELLWKLGIHKDIDTKLLERVRFPVDAKTPLTKVGCDVGSFALRKGWNDASYTLYKKEDGKMQEGDNVKKDVASPSDFAPKYKPQGSKYASTFEEAYEKFEAGQISLTHVAKTVRTEGEAWSDAMNRASQMIKKKQGKS